jgi:hypothetical protein
MLNTWGIKELVAVKKLGGYYFRIEFLRLEDKNRVLEGGPWRHKGDALLLVHYDGLVRPSEVKIETIPLWVRLYDLPDATMKEAFGKQLGSQLGRYIRSDCNFLGYVRVRVDYPLIKPLLPEMKVKIKRRGLMNIILRYENVPPPPFVFTVVRWDMQLLIVLKVTWKSRVYASGRI